MNLQKSRAPSVVDDENDIPGMGAKSSRDDIIIDRQKLKETDEYKPAMELKKNWLHNCKFRKKKLSDCGGEKGMKLEEEVGSLVQRREELNREKLDLEERLEERKQHITDLQKKSTKLEDALASSKKLSSFRQMQLTKLQKSFLQAKEYGERLKSCEKDIQTGGGFILAQIHHCTRCKLAAYKRAVLRFHPDRASRGDLRQQVEAEERFKLISRMREKFLFTT
ncbi:hypothetical protein Dimus_014801 [Dionaea muscipula]